MKRFPVVAVVILSGLGNLGSSQAVADETKKPQDPKKEVIESPYYPLKVGTRWTYKIGDKKVHILVAKHEKVGDTMAALIQAGEDLSLDDKTTEHVAATAEGIFRFAAQGEVAEPPVMVLKLPVKKDSTWKIDSTISGISIKGDFKSSEEEVTVPAGKFKTITATSDNVTMGDEKMTITYWFAKDVGMVKQIVTRGNNKVLLELEKFEAPK